MKKNILVTGAAGKIGNVVCKHLEARATGNYFVRPVDIRQGLGIIVVDLAQWQESHVDEAF